MSTEVKLLGAIFVITTLIIGGGVVLTTRGPAQMLAENTMSQDLLASDNAHVITQPQAKVLVIEFGDYQCPACKAYAPQMESLIQSYNGTVSFMYRHFPLPFHKNSRLAASAAEAAANQGKFWEMHTLLYQRQDEWSILNNPKEQLVAYAQELGLDKERFITDLESPAVKQKVETDAQASQIIGLQSTPSFFVNGRPIRNLRSVDNIKRVMDEELAKQYVDNQQ